MLQLDCPATGEPGGLATWDYRRNIVVLNTANYDMILHRGTTLLLRVCSQDPDWMKIQRVLLDQEPLTKGSEWAFPANDWQNIRVAPLWRMPMLPPGAVGSLPGDALAPGIDINVDASGVVSGKWKRAIVIGSISR